MIGYVNHAGGTCVIEEKFVQQPAGVNFDYESLKLVHNLQACFLLKSNILRINSLKVQLLRSIIFYKDAIEVKE